MRGRKCLGRIYRLRKGTEHWCAEMGALCFWLGMCVTISLKSLWLSGYDGLQPRIVNRKKPSIHKLHLLQKFYHSNGKEANASFIFLSLLGPIFELHDLSTPRAAQHLDFHSLPLPPTLFPFAIDTFLLTPVLLLVLPGKTGLKCLPPPAKLGFEPTSSITVLLASYEDYLSPSPTTLSPEHGTTQSWSSYWGKHLFSLCSEGSSNGQTKESRRKPLKSAVSNHQRKTEFRMSFVWPDPQDFDSRRGSRNEFSFSSSFQNANSHLDLTKEERWGR